MSDQPQPVLLDSNAYFRLAPSIHPLLHGSFGMDPKYTLTIHAALEKEYRQSSRLRNKFEWVNDAEYEKDREGKRYQVPPKRQMEVDAAFSFLAAYATENNINVSLVDLKALAAGFVMGIPVVTDDGNMQKVADAHGIECWSTIKLLKLMVTASRVDMDKVKEILEYWNYGNDLPMQPIERFRKEFEKYFGTKCPI